MAKFLSLLKNPQFLLVSLSISLIGLLVIILWMLELSIMQILLVMVSIAIIWNIYFLLKQKREAKKSQEFEAELTQQADDQVYSTRPDKRPEMLNLKEKMDKAIEALKQSRIGGGQSGKAALYKLPFYMIVGPPGSGKSTALRYSELEFPYVDPDSKDPKVRGLGGTQNCDFWFTTDGILLDTAGRYVKPMAQSEDRQEWLTFLDYLKKHRRKMPINGVIVAVSIAEEEDKFFGVLTSDATTIERHARNIRHRIDELIQTFNNIEFPIYLVFTKCDRLNGFVEFFDDLDKTSRNQVWGYTFPKGQWRSRQLANIFKQEFKHLYRRLTTRRMFKLGLERKRERKRKIFIFPLEFYSARKKIALFLERLFEYNRYLENPILRGFYFTSGTQVGNPIDRVVSSMAKEFGFSADVFHEQPTETRSYFLKDLMSKVIFPDQGLVVTSKRGEIRRWLTRVAMSAAIVVLFATFLFGMANAFKTNRSFLDQIGRHLQQLRQQAPIASNARRTIYFEQVRRDLVRLDRGPKWRHRLGMYPGDRLRQPTAASYFSSWHDLTLRPLAQQLERTLRNQPRDDERAGYRTALKGYLMLSGGCAPDTNFIKLDLTDRWLKSSRIRNPSHDSQTRAQFAFYARRLAALHADGVVDDRLRVPGDSRTIAEARNRLAQAPVTETVIARWRERASKEIAYNPLPGDQNVVQSTAGINGIFTRQGWDEIVAPEMSGLGTSAQKGDCVLGGSVGIPPAQAAQLQARLSAEYQRAHVDAWQSFVAGLRIRDISGVEDAASTLRTLSSPDSPLLPVLREIAANASPPGRFSNGQQNATSGIQTLTSAPEGEAPPLQNYLAELAKLQAVAEKLASSDDPGRDARDVVLAVLNSGAEMEAAWLVANGLLNPPRTAIEQQLASLLKQPIAQTWNAIRGEASRSLNAIWRTQVVQFYNSKLRGRYPFVGTAAEEAFLPDVIAFFKPGGILWNFYDQQLSGLVQPQTWQVKTWRGSGISAPATTLAGAFRIKRHLFPNDSPEPLVHFELKPILPRTTELYCVALRYDGTDLLGCTGSIKAWALQWPNTSGAQGIRLRVFRKQSNKATGTVKFDGSWALFRLLDTITPSARDGSEIAVAWRLTGTFVNGRAGLAIRPTSSREVFRKDFFSSFVCQQSF